jgi:hypothetical protein
MALKSLFYPQLCVFKPNFKNSNKCFFAFLLGKSVKSFIYIYLINL